MDAGLINGRRPSDLRRLAADAEFCGRLDADPVIQGAFESADEDPQDAINELFMTLGSDVVLCGAVVVKAPVAGVIALLDCVESPFMVHGRGMGIGDVYNALYILINGRNSFDGLTDIKTQLPAKAKTVCARIKDLDVVAACRGIYGLRNQCFRAFRLIRDKALVSAGRVRYDAIWIASIIAQTSKVCNLSPMEIIWETPMPIVSNLIVQARRMDGWDVRRSTQAFDAMDRLEQLIDIRLSEYKDMR